MNKELVEQAVRYTSRYVKGDFVNKPVTIQQKLAYKKIFGVTDLMVKCVDKLGVKEYARELLGLDPCPKTIEVYESPKDVMLDHLPEKFVLKCNHGCGYNIVQSGSDRLDEGSVRLKLEKWLSTNYATVGYELQYDGIRRKCYAEEYVGDLSGVKDYKISCFNGIPMFCQVISGRGTSHQCMNYYDCKFNYLSICRMDFPNNPLVINEKPLSFGLMLEYSKILSSPFDYVRCDFYEKDGRLYLGEMTFTPGNARMRYKGDPETSCLLGTMMRMSENE